VNAFTTFYFKTGYETLIPLINLIENAFPVEISDGGYFFNAYTKDKKLLQDIEVLIYYWSKKYPHIQLEEVSHD